MKKRILLVFLVLFLLCGCSTQPKIVTNEPSSSTTVETRGLTAFDLLENLINLVLDTHPNPPSAKELIIGALEGIIASVNDPFTYGVRIDENSGSSASGESYVGLGMGVVETDQGLLVSVVYENSDAYVEGIRPFDVLVEAKGTDISEMTLDEATPYLKGELNDVIDIKVKRNGITDPLEFNVTVSEVLTPTIISEVLDNSIGYIKINNFSSGSSKLFSEKLEELENEGFDNLIIDVRDNPGGSDREVLNIIREFAWDNNLDANNNEKKLFTMTTEGLQNVDYYAKEGATKKAYDIKVLTNENSASAAEVFAAAMKEALGYEVIGEKTFGKNVYQNVIYLWPGHYTVYITAGEWLTPNGNSVKGTGFVPDVEIIDLYDSIAYPYFEDELKFDTVSEDNKLVQHMLRKMGYDVRVDGYFDQNMKNILSNTDVLGHETVLPSDAFNLFAKYEDALENNDIILNEAIDRFND